MNKKRLKQLQQDLSDWRWAWQRRNAAEELSQDDSPEAIHLLAKAVASSEDAQVRCIAIKALRQLTDQKCINEVCAVWAENRNDMLLSELVNERGWIVVARQLPTLTDEGWKKLRKDWHKVVDALTWDGSPEAVQTWEQVAEVLIRDGSPEAVRTLEEAAMRSYMRRLRRIAKEVRIVARRALNQLAEHGNAEAQEALCRLLLAHGAILTGSGVKKYTPRDPVQRALFYFLTKQWGKYEDLDFDQGLLKIAYQGADQKQRQRMAKIARAAGRPEWVKIVASARRTQHLEHLSEKDWKSIQATLENGRQWETMWQLAKAAPFEWSIRFYQQLKTSGWRPSTGKDRSEFTYFIELADACLRKTKDSFCFNILQGHEMSVCSISLSPDAQLLASGSYDETAWLWSLPNGTALKMLTGHNRCVKCVAVSPNGEFLVTGGYDGTVRLWSLPDGRALKTFKRHTYRTEWLTISPDGQLLMSGSHNEIVIGRLPNGEILQTHEGHVNGCLEFNSHGQGLLVTGNWNGTMWLWNLPVAKVRQPLKGHTGRVKCAIMSPDKQLLASGSSDKTVRVWSLSEGALLHTLEGHSQVISCLAISPDGRLLVSGSLDNTIRVWRLPDGTPLCTLKGHTRGVKCLAISPEGRILYTGSNDSTIRIWALWRVYVNRLSVGRACLEDLEMIEEILRAGQGTNADRKFLEFGRELLRWHWRHDIEVEETPRRISVGEFDIEIDA